MCWKTKTNIHYSFIPFYFYGVGGCGGVVLGAFPLSSSFGVFMFVCVWIGHVYTSVLSTPIPLFPHTRSRRHPLPSIDFYHSLQIPNVVLLLMIIERTYRLAILIFTQISCDEFHGCLFNVYLLLPHTFEFPLAFHVKSFRA